MGPPVPVEPIEHNANFHSIQSSHVCPLCNACHQVRFQKKHEISGPRNSLFSPF